MGDTPNDTTTAAHVEQDCAKAPINKKWLFKLLLIAVVFIGFGGLGLYDAVVAYPARGEKYADWAKWQYLAAAQTANTEEFGIFERQSSVTDPAAEFERLSDPETERRNATDAQSQSSSRRLRAAMYTARLAWLRGLKTIGRLTPEETTIELPREEFEALQDKWSTSGANPKPLKGYDIPSQWVIMVVCWFIGGWMVLHILRVMGQHFKWDASEKQLTLPNGASIKPADLEEVDKRKWDKFIVFLKLKGSHGTHGGQELKVDTYQHEFVEDWILAMEEEAFGPQEAGDETGSNDAQPDESAQPAGDA